MYIDEYGEETSLPLDFLNPLTLFLLIDNLGVEFGVVDVEEDEYKLLYAVGGVDKYGVVVIPVFIVGVENFGM